MDVATAVAFRSGFTAVVVGLLLVVQRVPLALSTYPTWTTFWAWALYRRSPERAALIALPVILLGLALALDVLGVLALSLVGAQDGLQLPKLGVVGSSPIMNVEPVFALVLAWLLLGQSTAPMQVTGALLVVGAVIHLNLFAKHTGYR